MLSLEGIIPRSRGALVALAILYSMLFQITHAFRKVTGKDKPMPLSWEPHLTVWATLTVPCTKMAGPTRVLPTRKEIPTLCQCSIQERMDLWYFGDPDNPIAYKNNPGGATREENSDKMGTGEALTNWVLRFENAGVAPRQVCPSMTPEPEGGFDGDKYDTRPGSYYCIDSSHGYCDRRSGACWCYTGYTGIDCGTCRPTHHEVDTVTVSTYGGENVTASVCVPKIACPNDCSGAGVCDYSTGTCKCEEYRYGDDCSTPICRKFHEFCTVCSAEKCLECIEKHYVDPSTGGCASCAQKHDPRCFRCDENKCLQCADPMLSSLSSDQASAPRIQIYPLKKIRVSFRKSSRLVRKIQGILMK